jgi:hypothetical protein
MKMSAIGDIIETILATARSHFPMFAGRRSRSFASRAARRGRYNVAKLIEQHGDAKLTDPLLVLADCRKSRSASAYDRCQAVYEGL